MSVARFLAFAGEPQRLRQLLSTLVPREEASPRLNRVLDCPDLVVFASPETPLVRLADDRGLVVGRLFADRSNCTPLRELDAAASAAAGSTGGRLLLNDSWGNYVAFLRDGGRTWVLRDPSAAVPAYRAAVDGVHVYFSDLALCGDLGLQSRDVDPEFLRQWLTFPYLRTHRTGLAGISEIVPGAAHCRSGGAERIEIAWTPWRAMASRPQLTDFETAAAELRSTILRTVPPQLRDREALALELSGGLDSSIVAAALANCGIFLPAVNFSTRMPDGDERTYARTVASALGLKLTEVEEAEEPLDLRPEGRQALRPSLSPVLQPLNRALCGFARKVGARGLVTGGGGDNLFCYLTTAAPVLDAARDLGLVPAVANTLRDVASVVDCTLWTVARFAVRKRLAQVNRRAWKRDERLLAPAAMAAEMDEHPWLEAPRNAPPGKLEHVSSLIRAHHYMEPEHPTGEAIIHPLINQPLMELCLSIPSWLWIRGGRNRSVARRAFEDRLPPETIGRRTKGRLESMCARAFEENRSRLRELLLGGELAGRRLILLEQVEQYLRGSGPAPDDDYFRLFDLASLELWLRSRAG